MPRIRLQSLEKYEFKYETILKVRDINYGGYSHLFKP